MKGSTTLDGYGYTYDRNSNRLTRSNATNSAFNETYSYDGTNQLTGFTRGSASKDWGFDALGNRTSVTTNGGTPDTWSANAQNQITGIGSATTPTYDLNGNMTGDEQGRTLVYDAWNRLVQVKNGSTVLKAYTYDGGNRKIMEDDGTTVTQLIYSGAWQVLEEKVGSSYTNLYVWSAAYVDALVMRDDGAQRVWAVQDANWNVTALVDDSGNVLERFAYDDPYGKVTAYDASWTVKSGGSGYVWVITFQGMRYDETTGNFYQRNRWYSPILGRWITVDPIRFEARDNNLYRPAGNNFNAFSDPSGLQVKVVPQTPGQVGKYSVDDGNARQNEMVEQANAVYAHLKRIFFDGACLKCAPTEEKQIIESAMKKLAKQYVNRVESLRTDERELDKQGGWYCYEWANLIQTYLSNDPDIKKVFTIAVGGIGKGDSGGYENFHQYVLVRYNNSQTRDNSFGIPDKTLDNKPTGKKPRSPNPECSIILDPWIGFGKADIFDGWKITEIHPLHMWNSLQVQGTNKLPSGTFYFNGTNWLGYDNGFDRTTKEQLNLNPVQLPESWEPK
jgi:RHS repeat-associated protein